MVAGGCPHRGPHLGPKHRLQGGDRFWVPGPLPTGLWFQVAVAMGKALLEFVWTLRFHGDA